MKLFRAGEVNLAFSKNDWFFPRNPDIYGKVAVLMGGMSPECGISLQSGETIATALREAGVDAHALVINEGLEWLDVLRHGNFDRAAIALHGAWGEEGQCQAVLETLGIPYTGSDMLASALAMNKIKAKELFLQYNIPTPAFMFIDEHTTAAEVFSKLKAPIAIKPVQQGSTIGISRIDSPEEFRDAFALAKKYDKYVFAEEWVEGEEYTVSILGKQVLSSIKITPMSEYYDFDAKYVSEETRFECPSDLKKEDEHLIRQIGLRTYQSLDCSGWGRVDLMRDKSGKFWVLEVNTIPGMTSHSLVPQAARVAGFTLPDLCLAILASSLDESTLAECEENAHPQIEASVINF